MHSHAPVPNSRGSASKLLPICGWTYLDGLVQEIDRLWSEQTASTVAKNEESDVGPRREQGPIVLNTGAEYVAEWLLQEPSPIRATSPSFEAGGGAWISIHSGSRRQGSGSDILVAMNGTRHSPVPDHPERDHLDSNVPVIGFRIVPLSAVRTELFAACYQEVGRGYFSDLLREIEQRWGAPDESPKYPRGPVEQVTDAIEPGLGAGTAAWPAEQANSSAVSARHDARELPSMRPADYERYVSAWRLMTPLRKQHWTNTQIAERFRKQHPQLRVSDRETVAKVIRLGEARLLDPQ